MAIGVRCDTGHNLTKWGGSADWNLRFHKRKVTKDNKDKRYVGGKLMVLFPSCGLVGKA